MKLVDQLKLAWNELVCLSIKNSNLAFAKTDSGLLICQRQSEMALGIDFLTGICFFLAKIPKMKSRIPGFFHIFIDFSCFWDSDPKF